jgi:hypothetical protein
VHTEFWWGRDHLEGLGIDGRIILIKKDFQVVGCGDLNWISLVQERDRWQPLVKEVMNLQGP